jgi:hypothetical protein
VLEQRQQYCNITLNKSLLIDIIKRLSVLTDKLFKTIDIKFDFANNIAILSVDSQSGDKGQETLPIVSANKFGDCALDILSKSYQVDYLRDGLEKVKVDDSGNIVFDIQEKKLLYFDDGHFIYFMSEISNN